MRCKQGDLAIVVYSDAGNEGKIVRCLKLLGIKRWVDQRGVVFDDPTWEIDTALPDWLGTKTNSIMDSRLRPIRRPPDDAKDETLSWLPVPSTEKEYVYAEK
jgi:hypothetical protein